MINDTLDMAKIEAGKVEVQVSPLSPRAVINDIVGSMESLAQKKHIALTANFDAGVPEIVLCDAPKLQQVLTNLIGNAIKFTDEGHVTIVAGSQVGNQWFFKVIDSGIGMPSDAATYIFETFSQVNQGNKRSREGTGLGLAITKRLVTYMGGTVAVETALGEGSTFTVTLPCEVKEMVGTRLA
jgi:signal transduction histidine kinase